MSPMMSDQVDAVGHYSVPSLDSPTVLLLLLLPTSSCSFLHFLVKVPDAFASGFSRLFLSPGGAIDMQGNSVLSCDGTVYKSNVASGKGGAIYVEGSSTVTVSGASSFDGNTAARGGAIVFSTGASTRPVAHSMSL